MNKKACKI